MEKNEFPDLCYLENDTIVDPGLGYRLVKVGEITKKDDEFLVDGQWYEFFDSELGEPVGWLAYPIRRKLDTAPAIDPDQPANSWTLANVKWDNKESSNIAQVLDQEGKILVDCASLEYCLRFIRVKALDASYNRFSKNKANP